MTTRLLSALWLLLTGLLTLPAAHGQNLLVNPGFESGNTGFTTSYTYVAPPGTDPGAGSYTVSTNSRAYNSGLGSYGDHTTGTGNYMIVNGATPNNVTVWEQTVTGLQPNTTYRFSFWLLNTSPTNKARLQVSANGSDVGAAFTNPNDGGNWQFNSLDLPTGTSTQLVIRLRNLERNGNGNDFGLDDMGLFAPPSANPQLMVNNVTTAAISTSATINGTQISPLSATLAGPAGASVTSFTIVSVPSVGTLRVGNSTTGTVVTAGQVIGAAQASQLYYTPAGNTTQTVSFTYTATDSNGNFSANTATYSIPLTASPAPSGCGPAYGGGPSSSGLAADYYAGYFADNLNFFATTSPALTRIDPQLNFASSSTTAPDGWGNIVPPAGGNAADPNTFSSRYRGSIYIATAGSYTFTLTSDDASYMWLDGAALAPTLSNATINNGGSHAARPISATVTLSVGLHNILVYYGENTGGNTLTLQYSSTAGAGFGTRIVPNSVLCAGPSAVPPVANNVTDSPAMPSSNSATAIAALSGTDANPGGSVTGFIIGSLPPAASGILYVGLGAVPVAVGQTLTAAEAANLSFDPAPDYTGNATFTFFAVNNAGLASNTPATYTIPVVGPEADVTTTLSGPATLGAGVSSGTYTVTYSNNGPQAATQVTQTVRLPTGASMTAAQRAALPATASYNSSTNTIDFGVVPVLNSGSTNTFTFSFTAPSAQGSGNLLSTVGARTGQGANTAPDQATLSITVQAANFFVTNDDSNEVPGGTAKSGNVILNDANPANLANSQFTATLVTGATHGTVALNADGSYTYTPNAGYLGPDAFTYRVDVPTASPRLSNISTVSLNVYDATLVCTSGTGTNLLANPSFSNGNTGFSSTYAFVGTPWAQNGPSGLVPEATYTVASNARDYHPNFTGFGRRGAGDNFMIVNGSQNLSVVYQQTVTVRPNTYYNFSAFASSVNEQSPAQLGFVINGKSTSSVTTLVTTFNQYTRISDLWFSGNNTTAVIEIRDVNKDFGGNDFGLDDLYMGTCAVGLTANNVTSPALSNTAPATAMPAFSATVTSGPAVASFTVQTLPSATAGVLFLGSTPVIPGQVILLADAVNLFFDPVAGFVGSATFTYTATDESGAGSNNTATYTIPVDNRPLPVSLVSFEAQAIGTTARLTWRTAQELNNDRFEVQRSLDGRTFTTIGTVAGRGTHSGISNYSFQDAGIGARTSVASYRLRQVDHDGTATHSSVQVVRFAGVPATPTVALYPNPTTTTVTLDLTQLPAGTYQVQVLDGVGRLLRNATYTGGEKHTLEVKTLVQGTYIVQVRNSSGLRFVQRLIKE